MSTDGLVANPLPRSKYHLSTLWWIQRNGKVDKLYTSSVARAAESSRTTLGIPTFSQGWLLKPFPCAGMPHVWNQSFPSPLHELPSKPVLPLPEESIVRDFSQVITTAKKTLRENYFKTTIILADEDSERVLPSCRGLKNQLQAKLKRHTGKVGHRAGVCGFHKVFLRMKVVFKTTFVVSFVSSKLIWEHQNGILYRGAFKGTPLLHFRLLAVECGFFFLWTSPET